MPSGQGAPPKRVCQAETLAGEACRSFALPGSLYCLAHDPERWEQAQQARSRGGAHASKVRSMRGKRQRLGSMSDLVRFNAGVIQDALSGALDPQVAKAVLYGVSIQRQLVEASDLAGRVAALEQRLAHGTTVARVG